MHEILQVAFRWKDSHLHPFGCGPKYYSDDTEYCLMEYEVRARPASPSSRSAWTRCWSRWVIGCGTAMTLATTGSPSSNWRRCRRDPTRQGARCARLGADPVRRRTAAVCMATS
jgi:hypothetical protein